MKEICLTTLIERLEAINQYRDPELRWTAMRLLAQESGIETARLAHLQNLYFEYQPEGEHLNV